MFGIFRKRPALTEAQRWALAAGQCHGRVLDDPHDRFACCMLGFAARRALSESYNVHDTETALRCLTWLESDGHNTPWRGVVADPDAYDLAPALAAFIAEHRDELVAHGGVAWDAVRTISVARWCAKAGHISEHEAWRWILRAARRLQREYASWEELADHFVLGVRFFDKGAADERFVDARDFLVNDAASPWRSLAWRTPLGDAE